MDRIAVLILLAPLMGCVLKSEHDKLKQENEQLKADLKEAGVQIPTVKKSPSKKDGKKNLKEEKFYTDEEALAFVKDYYEFYRRDYNYRNPIVRQDPDHKNEFAVSLEECNRNIGCKYDNWDAVVRYLVIENDGQYGLLNDAEKSIYEMGRAEENQ